MESRKVDRPAVRELVRRNMEELIAHAKAGGNAHQKALDQKDLVDEMVSKLSLEDQAAFYTVYTQEMNAKNAEVSSKAEAIDIDNDARIANDVLTSKILGVIVILAILVFIFMKLNK